MAIISSQETLHRVDFACERIDDRPAPKWTPLAREYHGFLPKVADLLDWGLYHHDYREPRYRSKTEKLNDWFSGVPLPPGEYPPTALSKPMIQSSMDGENKFYLTHNRATTLLMPMIDADAHDGETDATAAVQWVNDTYFPGAYDEPSGRGHHGHPLIERGRRSPEKMNVLLDKAHVAIGALAKAQGFNAKLELKGRYSGRDAQGLIPEGGRGQLARIPSLPNGRSDFHRLTSQPIYGCDVLLRIVDDARHLLPKQPKAGKQKASRLKTPPPITVCGRDFTLAGEPDARKATLACGLALAQELGRVPTVHELESWYSSLRPGKSDARRRGRIGGVVKFVAKGFDASKLAKPGYESRRQSLLKLVSTHCTDDRYDSPELAKWRGKLNRELLAIILFAGESNSFLVRDDHQHQWTMPNEAIDGMIRRLKADGAAKISIPSNAERTAAKRLLVAAGLWECFDSDYQIGRAGRKGIGKKFHVGPNHPRYAEFQRFAAGVRAERLADRPSPTEQFDAFTREWSVETIEAETPESRRAA